MLPDSHSGGRGLGQAGLARRSLALLHGHSPRCGSCLVHAGLATRHGWSVTASREAASSSRNAGGRDRAQIVTQLQEPPPRRRRARHRATRVQGVDDDLGVAQRRREGAALQRDLADRRRRHPVLLDQMGHPGEVDALRHQHGAGLAGQGEQLGARLGRQLERQARRPGGPCPAGGSAPPRSSAPAWRRAPAAPPRAPRPAALEVAQQHPDHLDAEVPHRLRERAGCSGRRTPAPRRRTRPAAAPSRPAPGGTPPGSRPASSRAPRARFSAGANRSASASRRSDTWIRAVCAQVRDHDALARVAHDEVLGGQRIVRVTDGDRRDAQARGELADRGQRCPGWRRPRAIS